MSRVSLHQRHQDWGLSFSFTFFWFHFSIPPYLDYVMSVEQFFVCHIAYAFLGIFLGCFLVDFCQEEFPKFMTVQFFLFPPFTCFAICTYAISGKHVSYCVGALYLQTQWYNSFLLSCSEGLFKTKGHIGIRKESLKQDVIDMLASRGVSQWTTCVSN